MVKTLKQRLDSLPREAIDHHHTRFDYAIEARAEYELGKRMKEGKAQDFPLIVVSGSGAALSNEQIQKLIWTPNFFPLLHPSIKDVRLWSGEYNAFINHEQGRIERKDIVEWAWSLKGEHFVNKFGTDSDTQDKAMEYGRAKLISHNRGDRAYWGSSKASGDGKKLNDLVWGLIDMYAKEMGVTLP